MTVRGETGLLAKIQAANAAANRGDTCTMGLLLQRLTPTDRADIEAALADKAIAATIIAKVLNEAGHRIGNDPVQRHRRGACHCGRTG